VNLSEVVEGGHSSIKLILKNILNSTMAPTLTTVAISAMIGVLIGFAVNEAFGGRRSSIGVHRSDGRLLSFWPGVIFFALVTIMAGTFTTMVSTMLTDMFSGLGALLLAVLGVSLFLNMESYSR
jgi:hypothetical protein